MNRTLVTSVIMLFFMTIANASEEHLLPLPQKSTFNNDVSFNLNQGIKLNLPTIGENDPATGEELTELIRSNGGTVDPASTNIINVEIITNVPDAEFQDEAYSIEVTSSKIAIKASTLRGAYWATQTLWQLSEGNEGKIPGCNITDWAAFRLRGYMHDVGRGFLEFDELKNEILKMSRYKINTFHWHITDNQGWRLESKIYPQLTANASFTRHPGKFYTIAQAKELVKLANKHGITVIPEIEMPGHSEAFRKAMGHSMLTPEGLAEMKLIMTEACETFAGTEWMHIGTDEVRAPDKGTIDWTAFVPVMVSHIRACGKKVASWAPGYNYTASGIDMTQMWSSSGKIIPGVPAIDSRYHYTNHYDNYADIVGLYNSTIAEQKKGSDQYPGLIMAFWNDRMLPTDESIIKQNSVYSSVLAAAERSWLGGGKGYFSTIGTMLTPTDTDFADWERRFLYHKANYLKDEPIVYVKQTNVKWKITDAFPNGGNLDTSFPPETAIAESYTYNGKTYYSKVAIGAGIYLRHVWGATIPTFYSNPQTNSTAYAYTYVYSPKAQRVGVMLEFQNYGRSESDLAPPQGKWDYKGSRIWINNNEIAPPVWENTHTTKNTEIPLRNENLAARAPIPVDLQKGWNKVFMKLPVGAFSTSQVRLVKWMFTCVFTTPDGKDAVDGLIYSPDKSMNPSLDTLIDAIDNANSIKSTVITGDNPGEYSSSIVAEFTSQIAEAEGIRNQSGLPDESYQLAAEKLINHNKAFKSLYNQPKGSTSESAYWYSMITPKRNNNVNNCISYKGNNAELIGETYADDAYRMLWKFIKNDDNTYTIVNRTSDSHISPNSTNNTSLKAQTGIPTSGGWSFIFTGTENLLAVINGSVQMNQTSSNLSNKIYNWGGGTNTTDVGCLYQIKLRDQTATSIEDNRSGSGFSVSSNDMQIRVSGCENNHITISDTSGRKLYDKVSHQSSITFQVATNGVYIVTVEDKSTKIVVK